MSEMARSSGTSWQLYTTRKLEAYKSSLSKKENCAGKQATNILVRQYAETSDLQVPADRNREIREEPRAGFDHQEEPMTNSPRN